MSMIISDLSNRKMIIRKLGIADRKAFFELTDAVVEALANKDRLIPMSEEEADVTFFYSCHRSSR